MTEIKINYLPLTNVDYSREYYGDKVSFVYALIFLLHFSF
jgi:hypothetical protein